MSDYEKMTGDKKISEIENLVEIDGSEKVLVAYDGQNYVISVDRLINEGHLHSYQDLEDLQALLNIIDVQYQHRKDSTLPTTSKEISGAIAEIYNLISNIGNAQGVTSILTQLEQVAVNVIVYGAKGDGVTDDTTAIQNAINRCYQLGGGNVLLPKGTFLISSSITIPAGVTLVGKSAVKYTQVQDSTLPNNGTIIQPNGDFDVIIFDRASNFAGVRSLSIHYPNITFSSSSTPSTHSAIKFTTARDDSEYTENVIIEDIDITGFQCGVYMPWIKDESLNYAQYYYVNIRNISIAKCKCGVFLNGMSDIVVDNILCKDLFGMDLTKIYPYTCPMVNDLNFMSNVWNEKSMNLINDLGNSQINKYAIYGGGGHGMILQDCVAIHYDRCVSASINNYAGLVLRGCTTKSRIYGLRSALNKMGVLLLASECCRNTRIDFISCRIENNYESGLVFKIANEQKSDCINFTSCDICNNSLGNPGEFGGILSENSSDLEFSSCFLGDDQLEHTQKIPFYGTTNGTKFIGCDLSGTEFDALPMGEGNEFISCKNTPSDFIETVVVVPNGVPITPNIPSLDEYLENQGNVSVRIHFKRLEGTHVTIKYKNDDIVGIPSYVDFIDLAPGESIKFSQELPSEWIWFYSYSTCYTKYN